jgi:hypothetical protein
MRRRDFLFQLRREPDDLRDRLAAHLKALDQFARAYFGCGPDDVSADTCKAWRARTDARLFDAARQTAIKLFDLKD